MTFQGTVSSYTPNPFMMTMTDGVLLDKNGNPVSTAAPVTTPHRRQHNKRSRNCERVIVDGSSQHCSRFFCGCEIVEFEWHDAEAKPRE